MGLENGNVEIKDFLRAMDVASALRREREKAEKQLDIHETKEEIRKKLLATAEVTGEELTSAEVDAAIESFFSGLYEFKQPEKNFSYKLARMYIARGTIAKAFTGITLGLGALVGVIWLSVAGIKSIYHNSREGKVESAIEASYQNKQNLLSDIQELRAFSPEGVFPEAGELETIAQVSASRLKQTDSFFNTYCSDGTADDDINWDNYEEAKEKLKPIDETLQTVAGQVEKGQAMVQTHQDIMLTQKNLDTLIAEVRNSKPPRVLSERAESAYQSGTTALQNRQLQEGQKYKTELIGIRTNVQQFAVLPSQLEQVYSSIKSVAKEKEALSRAETMYDEGKSYIDSVDVPQLKRTVGNLQNLDTILKQDYTIKIVSRRGVKSGIDRYYRDKRGKRVSGYYLIVEAIDRNGTVIPQQITNEENNQTSTVSMWGERVPQAIYEKVKQDKIDDGIIQNNVFARKQRGYLSMKVLMVGSRQGQITKW